MSYTTVPKLFTKSERKKAEHKGRNGNEKTRKNQRIHKQLREGKNLNDLI